MAQSYVENAKKLKEKMDANQKIADTDVSNQLAIMEAIADLYDTVASMITE